ncbi:hypothetical protein FRC19_006469 [Serendipita sp. 401]|nr:hypothetical protein FRC15_000646 [Serendipita sp. 397]KAG8828371.1 hypothetical protein FRC19_006469 [Serendipita sp. 401]KAG8869918.1 hypothetical protein FRC20_000656 [Serendipita sp. 405]
MLSLAQNSWLRYFTELPTSNGLPRDGEYDLNVTTGSNSTPEIHASSSLSSSSFDMALQQTIAEYGAARDHLEMVERKMRKMMEIKEARVKSEYELARRNLELVEKESVLVRQILSVPPGAEVIGLDDNQTEQRAKDDDEVTIRVERERGDNKMSMILEDREGEEDEQQHPFGSLYFSLVRECEGRC